MKSSWFSGLDKQELQDLRASLAGSLVARKRLSKILSDKIDVSTKTSRQKSSYESPSWAYLQADHRGYERALLEVIDLITEDFKEK